MTCLFLLLWKHHQHRTQSISKIRYQHSVIWNLEQISLLWPPTQMPLRACPKAGENEGIAMSMKRRGTEMWEWHAQRMEKSKLDKQEMVTRPDQLRKSSWRVEWVKLFLRKRYIQVLCVWPHLQKGSLQGVGFKFNKRPYKRQKKGKYREDSYIKLEAETSMMEP